MGALYGIMFGTIDVEDDPTRHHSRFKENLILSIPVGAVIGGFLGFTNQWLRSAPGRHYSSWPTNSSDNSVGAI